MTILLPHGEKTKIAKELKTSYVTVNSALKGITKSAKANIIRKVAIERGGQVYNGVLKSTSDRLNG